MLNHLRERLSLDGEHTPEALEQYGNTVSSTIPILIHDLRRSGRLRPGKQTVLIGFGVGLSWGGCVWTETWSPREAQSAQESSLSQPALEPVSPMLPENENALA
jgi:3-oxoacyl-[acyl-carrier-protein] synthase-3